MGRPLALLVLLGLSVPGAAGDDSDTRLTFIKTFPGSEPEYFRVTVREDGQASYQGGRAGEPGDPVGFRLSAPVAARLFELAAALNHFRGVKLEFPRSVAQLGQKVFVYEQDGERAEVSFNYTENATAGELQQWFERIARGRFLIQKLEFRVQFDRLGVPQALREFERDFNAGGLVDLEQFVPVLERLAADRRMMRVVQTRAQQLRKRIGGSGSRLQLEYGDQRSGWYTRVVVEEAGLSTYEKRRFDQPPQEQPLALPAGAAARLKELVRQADYFRGHTSAAPGGPLVGYRLTYEAGAEHREVAFSVPPDATLAEIVHILQQGLEQAAFLSRLREAVEKDSLMLQVILQELEGALHEKALADPREFAPLLEQIARASTTHPLVREQAERLLARIRAGG